MSALQWTIVAVLYVIAVATILLLIHGGNRRSTHEQLRDDIDQLGAVSQRGELS